MYDYLIVGAGLYGATFARMMTDAGKRCLVIEKRDHVGGNCADREVDGIMQNLHGGHIFHTNNEKVWHFVNCYADFWDYRHQVIANNDGEFYSLPFNMWTLYQMYGCNTPEDARKWIQGHKDINPKGDDLKSWAIHNVGVFIYEWLIKYYTEKQWGRPCSELPASIIKRLPIRYTWNSDYFSDEFQGMPIGGYSAMIEAMLVGIEVELGVDYMNGGYIAGKQGQTVYTGPLDALYNYDAGTLEYRSLRWEHETHDSDQLGIATVNYTGDDVPYTRKIEWRHFMKQPPKHSVVSTECPLEWTPGRERYYPVNDTKNNALAKAYKARARKDGLILGGRLATYKYLDMHQAIGAAMKQAERAL